MMLLTSDQSSWISTFSTVLPLLQRVLEHCQSHISILRETNLVSTIYSLLGFSPVIQLLPTSTLPSNLLRLIQLMPPHSTSTNRNGSSSQTGGRRPSSATSVADLRSSAHIEQPRWRVPGQDSAQDLSETGALFHSAGPHAARFLNRRHGHDHERLPFGQDRQVRNTIVIRHNDRRGVAPASLQHVAARSSSSAVNYRSPMSESVIPRHSGQEISFHDTRVHGSARDRMNTEYEHHCLTNILLRDTNSNILPLTSQDSNKGSHPRDHDLHAPEPLLNDPDVPIGQDMIKYVTDWQARWNDLSSSSSALRTNGSNED